jgi:hypothetical protein
MGSKLAGGGAPRPSGQPDQKKDGSRTSGGASLTAQGQASQAKAPVDMGALSNVGQGDKTAAHVEARNFPSAKPTESGNGAGPASAQQPKQNLPTGVTPLTEQKPMGATPYVEGADPIGIGARVVFGIGGAVKSALTQALTGEDPMQSILGEHLGKQTGWSADPSMTPGRDRAQRGTAKRESFDQTTLGSADNATRGDEAADAVPRSSDIFSDIQLVDRRKPGLKQMLESMI